MPKRGPSLLCIGSWGRDGFRKKDGVFPFRCLIAFGATEPNSLYPLLALPVLLSCFEGCSDEAWNYMVCYRQFNVQEEDEGEAEGHGMRRIKETSEIRVPQ